MLHLKKPTKVTDCSFYSLKICCVTISGNFRVNYWCSLSAHRVHHYTYTTLWPIRITYVTLQCRSNNKLSFIGKKWALLNQFKFQVILKVTVSMLYFHLSLWVSNTTLHTYHTHDNVQTFSVLSNIFPLLPVLPRRNAGLFNKSLNS